jgi:hypothetical protein
VQENSVMDGIAAPVILGRCPSAHAHESESCATNFILVGCILLHYLYMLYKHTTQKLYICDPQTQLNNFFYMFRPLRAIFRWYFEDFLLYCDTSLIFTSVRLSAIYCFQSVYIQC